MKNNPVDGDVQALIERIGAALKQFTSGRASMHVPPLDTDVDIVLSDCEKMLKSFTTPPAQLLRPVELPDDFSDIRIKKAKLWIERVMLDKPGMKEAKTCAAILDFIDEVQRLNATAQPVSDAANDVLAERQRQVLQEGWTPEHDDTHSSGEMAGAAACYARHVNGRQWVYQTVLTTTRLKKRQNHGLGMKPGGNQNHHAKTWFALRL